MDHPVADTIERFSVHVSFSRAPALTFQFNTVTDMRAFADVVARAEGVQSVSVNSEPATQFGGSHGFNHLAQESGHP